MSADGNQPAVGRGSAVLVHGGWGNPDDWRWVRTILEQARVEVITPDLPTHGFSKATVADDAAEVQAAIRSCPGPVVAVGWSYGGEVISIAAAGEPLVLHLVFVSSIPRLPSSQPREADWIDGDPHILVGEDGAFVLDNEWWFKAEAERLFSGDVLEHLRHNPRRLASRATVIDPLPVAGWQTIPSTVLIGRHDQLISESDRQWIRSTFQDVRILDTDHFVIFTHPKTVADTVIEALSEDQ